MNRNAKRQSKRDRKNRDGQLKRYREIIQKGPARFSYSHADHQMMSNVDPLISIETAAATMLTMMSMVRRRANKEPVIAQPLSKDLPKDQHACSTGDCPHSKQSECDDELERAYGGKEELENEP